MKVKFLICSLFFFSLFFGSDYSYEDIPVQESGRIKPLSTYSENQLLILYGKRSFKADSSKVSGIDWMLDVITNPNDRINQKVFYLSKWENSPDVEVSLGLANDNHYYSFQEIFEGLGENKELIVSLLNMRKEELTIVDQQIVNVYKKWDLYDKISNGLVVFLPLVDIDNKIIQEYLSINNKKISYSYLIRNLDQFKSLFKSLIDTAEDEWTDVHKKTADIFKQFQLIEYNLSQHASSFDHFKIIPSDDSTNSGVWLSPIAVLLKDRSQKQNKLLESYENFFSAYIDGDITLMNNHSNSIIHIASQIDSNLKINLLNKESNINKLAPFTKSMIFYILSFFIMGLSWVFYPSRLRKFALFFLFIGFLFHAYGLSLRMIVMQRPPVSTLYESILFVNFILVLFSLIFEFFRKDSLGILIATFGGVFLHFIGLKYASDGDTLGMLVAVLNSNFWLATHVTTITIGYGVSLVAGLMAHIYLLLAVFKPNSKSELNKVFNNIYGLTLMALFFTMFGTILGGIWADQSWGRFWGWDPKENGALLIVLWHLMMLHMRISGIAKQAGYAYGVSLVNIVVAIAWFGVNLLNVGLHSYGFTDNVATNLFMFIGFELLFTTSLYFIIRARNNKNLKS